MEQLLSGTESDQPVDARTLPGKRALMLLAEGFEDAEAACAADVLGWTRYRPSVATVELEIAGFHERIHGAFGTTFDADVIIDDVQPERYDALIVPGGFHNLGFNEIYDERVHELVRALCGRDCPIATMCVGALPVAEAGVLAGGRATTFALSSRHDNLGRLRECNCDAVREPVVEWNGILSCSGPSYSEQVMTRLLELLVGSEATAEVKHFRSGTGA